MSELPIQQESAPSNSATAFELLAPGVQRQLWRMGWTELRQIQADAIRLLLTSGEHVVIAAETASGKTEAAFLPIISSLSEKPAESIGALYIGPLKALSNDQFQRLDELCTYVEVPTHRWHGDVGVSAKTSMLRNPAGILLITPESVESLFVNRPHHLAHLFRDLRFIVIDELHAFLFGERGLHLESLLCRIRSLPALRTPPRLIGLSATLGDLTVAQSYIAPDQPQTVRVIVDNAGRKELKYRLHAYAPRFTEEDGNASTNEEADVMFQIAEDIVDHTTGSCNLIFANARSDIELFGDACNEILRRDRLPERFFVHHGSLSREIREDTEAIMKGTRDATAICSSTLEMGIDIGGVKMVGQIGAPWSVASLKQRLGRSGRRDGEPRIMRVYIQCRPPGPDTGLLDRLHLDLIQAIAATELLLEKWVEPPRPLQCDLSTLTQQCISVVAEAGGTSAADLYDRLVTRGAFRNIEIDLFRHVLRALGEAEVLEQMDTGELILGLEGEKIRARRDFYAAFETPTEFTVITDQQAIGMLPASILPAENDHLVLAARRWRVIRVDMDRFEILVEPARGKKAPLFRGQPRALHPRIREKMREVLAATTQYSYLDSPAREYVAAARSAAGAAGILTNPVMELSEGACQWFTWTGTDIQHTLAAVLASAGFSVVDRDVALEVGSSRAGLLEAMRVLASSPLDSRSVARLVFPKQRRKYDRLLPEELLEEAIVREVLDLASAASLLRVVAT